MNRLKHEMRELFGPRTAAYCAESLNQRKTPPLRRGHWIHDLINDRAALRARYDLCAEDGMVAIDRGGMDCDGTQYRRITHVPVPVSVVKDMRDEDEHRSSLDGPESATILRPSEAPETRFRSADRAMEAYEDGHPYSLTMGSLDEICPRMPSAGGDPN